MARSSVEINDKAFQVGLKGALARIEMNAFREVKEGAGDVARDYQQGVGIDSGELIAGIGVKETGRLGNEVFAAVGVTGVEHAAYHEFGTLPHVIEARNAQALYWPGAAHPVKRVNHPGTAPVPAFRKALLNASLTWRPRLLP